jgi:HSP20 family protein
MRYRRLSVSYTVATPSGAAWPLGAGWGSDRLRLLAPAWWRPDTDVWETAESVEIVLDLAGVEDDDLEVQLFANAVVVEGQRRLPGCAPGAVYHAAGIRQGPFQVQVPLPAPVDAERVSARFERGLLRITLPRRVAGA